MHSYNPIFTQRRGRPFLCRLGLHPFVPRQLWEPSISAEIVRHWRAWSECTRCGVEKDVLDLHWDADGDEIDTDGQEIKS